MKRNDHSSRAAVSAGFTLPAVLIIVGALLILAIGLLMVTGIERRTARSYVDLQRADMATRAGLEEVKGILDKQTANDDFLIVSDLPELDSEADKNLGKVPYLYIARGEAESGDIKYKYHPLFSVETRPNGTSAQLKEVPEATGLVGEDPVELETLPYVNPSKTAWVPIKAMKNGKEQTVARYAYWVEDLQGMVNPKVAGNDKGDGQLHTRSEYPFPAPGINREELSEKEPALDGIAIYALDEKATEEKPQMDLVKRVLDGRELMISPNSMLGAVGYSAPLKRGDNGLPEDTIAAALERNACPVLQAYEERPTIPFSPAFASAAGKPKLNLNKLLSDPRDSAVAEFASQIEDALPNFVNRQGGFKGNAGQGVIGDDYLMTLAANALDYADDDSEPSLKKGVYRGLDSYPLMSEIVLKTDYTGRSVKSGRLNLNFEFRLFVEFWNMTNLPVKGTGKVSYEVALTMSPLGTGTGGRPFDSTTYMDNKTISSHTLDKIDGKYFSKPLAIDLQPDEYKFYEFARVTYSIDVGPNNISYNTKFTLQEKESDARGISFLWNDNEVERIPKIVRDPFGMEFTILYPDNRGKCAIPGHSYGPYGSFINNIGDPRMSHYLRRPRLGENSYPSNISPNRRNVRRGTIYDKAGDRAFYGRVLPSEWPDRGHDSPYGNLSAVTDDKMIPTDETKYKYNLDTSEDNAPQRISNAGRFYSATELGRVYDPMMWTQEYDDLKGKPGSGVSDTKMLFLSSPVIPPNRNVFPDVSIRSKETLEYGGGNSLRVGRYEHKRFDVNGMRAAELAELFHTGKSTSSKKDEREGNVIDVNGQININTASKDTLRTMVAGLLKQDRELRTVNAWTHEVSNGRLAPKSTKIELGTPTRSTAADVIVEAIELRRPFAAMSELSAIRTQEDEPVFGNPDLYVDQKNINWSDAAAEELFARIHDAGTFRSRNFRVWVIGQSLGGTEKNPEVLAETRKVFTIFADPGERSAEGAIQPENNRTRVTYENDF